MELHPAEQFKLLETILPAARTLREDRFRADNIMYGLPDAALYLGMLHKLQPRKVVEVGSGYSTAVLMDWAEGRQVQVTAIDPYPDRLTSLLRQADQIMIVDKPVQDVPIDTFRDADLIFIDSTHVAKAGSDVNRLLFDILPTVRIGTWVHIHDIFWPEYPRRWLDERRGWNELYLMHAFLAFNEAFRVRLFANWVWKQRPQLSEEFPGGEPGGLWLERVA